MRKHPIYHKRMMHNGIDLSARYENVYSMLPGIVSAAGFSKTGGNYVTVNHTDGFSTLYAHCKCVTASAGQTVRCGDILGEVGQTGAATGPHLHFELHHDQVYINPIYYVA